jgi:hypothetical protein
MAKHHFNVGMGSRWGRCIGCGAKRFGPGDRCPPCQQRLRERKRRKPR